MEKGEYRDLIISMFNKSVEKFPLHSGATNGLYSRNIHQLKKQLHMGASTLRKYILKKSYPNKVTQVKIDKLLNNIATNKICANCKRDIKHCWYKGFLDSCIEWRSKE